MKVEEFFKFNFVKVFNFDKALLLLIVLCVFYIFKATDIPIHDFSNYYFGGKFLVTENFNSNIFFPYEFNKQISDLGYSHIFASYAPNTPFLALIFAPFSFLSIGLSKLIFNIISTILFIYSINKLFRFYKIDFKFLIVLPILFFVPIKNQILFGQVYFLLFFFLSEFWLAYEQNKNKKACLFLSIAIFLKVFPVVFIAIFLFKKQFKLVLYTSGICILILGISITFTGFNVWFFWFNSVLPKASNGEIATAYVDNYQSVFMFLKRVLVFEAIENPNSFYNNSKLFYSFIFGFKILLLTIGYFITNRNYKNLLLFSYWILASILFSPYGSTYTFLLLLFPFLLFLQSDISNNKKVILILLLFVINNFPLSLFINFQFPFSYLRLLFFIAFFVLFLLLFSKNIKWNYVFVFTLIPTLLFTIFNQTKKINSELFLTKNAPILIYNYKIENNNLTYFYWNEKGENKSKYAVKIENYKFLTLKNNQIFYNQKQLTFETSNKQKPVIINNKTIMYLSDYDRGIGFFTLRKMKLN